MSHVRLCVGLGNPGQTYAKTRHNVGVWWLEQAVSSLGGHFKEVNTCLGRLARINVLDHSCFFLIPNTYMNESGRAVLATCNYYKIPAKSVLIIQDELDFPPGTLRLKSGGGAGGHNGVKSVIQALKTDALYRLRIGVGRPVGPGDRYVLAPPNAKDKQAIIDGIQESLTCLSALLTGEWDTVMRQLHRSTGEA